LYRFLEGLYESNGKAYANQAQELQPEENIAIPVALKIYRCGKIGLVSLLDRSYRQCSLNRVAGLSIAGTLCVANTDSRLCGGWKCIDDSKAQG
jgi:hypothetical protein